VRVIVDAFQYGELFGRLPGGLLSQRYGGKRLVGFSLLLASLSTVLIPLTARVHFTLVVLLRFITGSTAVCYYYYRTTTTQWVQKTCHQTFVYIFVKYCFFTYGVLGAYLEIWKGGPEGTFQVYIFLKSSNFSIHFFTLIPVYDYNFSPQRGGGRLKGPPNACLTTTTIILPLLSTLTHAVVAGQNLNEYFIVSARRYCDHASLSVCLLVRSFVTLAVISAKVQVRFSWNLAQIFSLSTSDRSRSTFKVICFGHDPPSCHGSNKT